jgi:hypothetical protein
MDAVQKAHASSKAKRPAGGVGTPFGDALCPPWATPSPDGGFVLPFALPTSPSATGRPGAGRGRDQGAPDATRRLGRARTGGWRAA